MSSNLNNHPHVPPIQIDIPSLLGTIVRARADACDECQAPVGSLIEQISRLLAEVNRLQATLMKERLVSANLMAAIRAALGALDFRSFAVDGTA